MQSDSNLRETLRSIDHKSYPAYKSLRGSYRFADYVLSIDHVQGDPFAAPSHVRVTVDAKAAAFPEYAMKNTRTRTALADELLRTFAAQINHFTFKAKGSGKSGLISVTHCGQEILTRTACEVNEKEITARFAVGFPANGRTINAGELEKILFTYLPECVKHSFYYKNLDARRIRDAVELAEDQQAVRDQLKEQGLVAFVADDAVLPRESGISSRPMKQSVAFTSPESLRVTMQLPHRGAVTGMGIPKGITLIVGGGYHGKSTLLSLICGLLPCSDGQITINGRHLKESTTNVGYMLQHDELFEWRTIYNNVILGLEIQHALTARTKKRAHELLNIYGLSDFENSRPSELSGGMRQRAALIRTLVLEPELLLLDEPFSALDYQTRLQVGDDIGQIIRNEKKSALLVTHDLSEAISLADRVIVLSRRPAAIIQTIPLIFHLEEDTPMNRRNAPEFKSYFNLIWKELNQDEKSS